MNFSPADEAWWVLHDLKPALAKAKLSPRIYSGDRGWGPIQGANVATTRGAV